jgi:hypothetical protein
LKHVHRTGRMLMKRIKLKTQEDDTAVALANPPKRKPKAFKRAETTYNQKEHNFRKLATLSDLCKLFRRSPQCILNWRAYEALPAIVIPGTLGRAVRYDLAEVKRWAKANGKELA